MIPQSAVKFAKCDKSDSKVAISLEPLTVESSQEDHIEEGKGDARKDTTQETETS